VANEETLKKTLKKISKKGFAHKIQENLQISKESKEALLDMAKIPRELYIRKYGPTVGDRVRPVFFFIIIVSDFYDVFSSPMGSDSSGRHWLDC